ncbi:unnamed protein product [Albugo candida]|uniref:Uncharacterized protein n=1 Tax=Albugo candida TaxID=65357 RepID=A0A024GAU7_9STRA|nr:unnamed protein product [Albugo candida]|eukprot:CCI43981.1 unnamed protein product [Albugo candida]
MCVCESVRKKSKLFFYFSIHNLKVSIHLVYDRLQRIAHFRMRTRNLTSGMTQKCSLLFQCIVFALQIFHLFCGFGRFQLVYVILLLKQSDFFLESSKSIDFLLHFNLQLFLTESP